MAKPISNPIPPNLQHAVTSCRILKSARSCCNPPGICQRNYDRIAATIIKSTKEVEGEEEQDEEYYTHIHLHLLTRFVAYSGRGHYGYQDGIV